MTVHAIETVEAGFIEINEAGCPVFWQAGFIATDLIVIGMAMVGGVIFKLRDDVLDVIANAGINVDQLWINV